jgi:hypothetical protein
MIEIKVDVDDELTYQLVDWTNDLVKEVKAKYPCHDARVECVKSSIIGSYVSVIVDVSGGGRHEYYLEIDDSLRQEHFVLSKLPVTKTVIHHS